MAACQTSMRRSRLWSSPNWKRRRRSSRRGGCAARGGRQAILSAGGLLTILAAVLMSLSIQWAPTSLFNTLLMFGMLAGGFGLIARSLRAYPSDDDS